MCNLYSMTTARQGVLDLFRLSDNRAAKLDPTKLKHPARQRFTTQPNALTLLAPVV